MASSQLRLSEITELLHDWMESPQSTRLLALIALGLLSLLFWRIWRFSLRPGWHPREPKEYPHWIPYLGHAFSFLRNSEKLLTVAREKISPNDIFAITVAGQKIYVVTEPRLVGQVFNNSTCLSFDSFLHDIMREFGTSEAGTRAIIEVPAWIPKTSGKCKSVSQVAHDLQVRQTHGEELDSLGKHIVQTFRELLLSDKRLTNGLRDFDSQHHALSVIWLKRWTADCFIRAGQRAYFGDMLEAMDPDLPSTLMEMDDLSWQIFYRYPRLLRPRLQQLCDRILSALRRYLEIPVAERQSPAWFTSKLEEQYRMAGLSDEDIATQLLFLYWGINTNISKVGFWIIIHLLQNPSIVHQIRQETEPAFNEDGEIDPDYINRHCPTLNAVWLEALRLSAASTALRGITKDFDLGDKTLRAGNQVLVSARQLHLREADFGEHVDSFNHERFLNDNSLQRSPAFRPFGGGPTMCPGRLLAKYMTLNFVALVYRCFDLSLDGAQDWPKYEEDKPSIGIMSGKGDVRVRLTMREHA